MYGMSKSTGWDRHQILVWLETAPSQWCGMPSLRGAFGVNGDRRAGVRLKQDLMWLVEQGFANVRVDNPDEHWARRHVFYRITSEGRATMHNRKLWS